MSDLLSARWPRRVGAAVIVIALVTAGSELLAAAATKNTIHACSARSGGALRVRGSGGCKASEKSLSWNRAGPQGPAGVVNGYVGRHNSSKGTQLGLTKAFGVITRTPALPAGTYLVTATVNLAMHSDAGVQCRLGTVKGNASGKGQDEDAQTPPGANGANENLAIADSFLKVAAKDAIRLLCREYHKGSQTTTVNNAEINAIPVHRLAVHTS